jgi:hypothetical protein
MFPVCVGILYSTVASNLLLLREGLKEGRRGGLGRKGKGGDLCSFWSIIFLLFAKNKEGAEQLAKEQRGKWKRKEGGRGRERVVRAAVAGGILRTARVVRVTHSHTHVQRLTS